MAKLIMKFIFMFKCLLSIPLYYFCLYKLKNILDADLEVWENRLTVIKHHRLLIRFIRMFSLFKEFRSVVLFRLGEWGEILKYIIPVQNDLVFITKTDNIGKGLVIQHGYSTIIFAESIGIDCQIWHNVTIGRAHSGGRRPRIGNNVKICAGAVCIGDIVIGDNVTIAAGCIVTKDVPSNCVVVGNPAKIVRINNEKVSQSL